MKNFEAVIFDMDGLLLDSERIALNAFSETCLYFEFEPDVELFKRCIGTNAEMGEQVLLEGLPEAVDHKAFGNVWSQKYTERTTDKPVPLKTGAAELIAHIKELGIPIAVATSTRTQRAKQKLGDAGILDAFTLIVGGDQVEKSKPHPDIYLTAAEKLGADPGNCLALEDSENGVKSAFAAGMTVVQVPDLVAPSSSLKELGHIIVGSLLDVLDFDFKAGKRLPSDA